MRAQWRSTQFMISTIFVALLPAQAHSETPLDKYANLCMKELSEDGKHPITFPDPLQCGDGPILDITQNNTAIPANTPDDSKNFTATTKCDKPPLLDISKGGIGQCVPNSRLQVRQVEQAGVEPQKRPYYALLCRNYKYRARSSQVDNPEYDDIAMIVYSPLNHKTCFFQRYADPSLRDLPQEQSAFAAVGALPGKDIRSPFSDKRNEFWDLDVVKSINCALCHDANPFVRSPYAHQVARGDHALPDRKDDRDYAIVDLETFGAKWKQWHAYFNITEREYGEVGACLRCHNLGPGQSSDDFTNYSAGKLAPNQLQPSDPSSPTGFRLTHWMPPVADPSTWAAQFQKSVDEMLVCTQTPTAPKCKRTDLH